MGAEDEVGGGVILSGKAESGEELLAREL